MRRARAWVWVATPREDGRSHDSASRQLRANEQFSSGLPGKRACSHLSASSVTLSSSVTYGDAFALLSPSPFPSSPTFIATSSAQLYTVCSIDRASEALIDRFDRLDRCLQIAGMPDHVGVGEIHDN